MGQSAGPAGRSSRCIALVGPYLSGKTTLLESILARTGAVTRQGTIADKNTVGDATPEARDHGMSVELNVADVSFLGDNFTFIDCPGSIEFQHEGALASPGQGPGGGQPHHSAADDDERHVFAHSSILAGGRRGARERARVG